MQSEMQSLDSARKAWIGEVSKNIGLGVVWSDEYRALLNRAGNPHTDIIEKISLYNVLWTREIHYGAEARIAKALADHAAALAKERADLDELANFL